MNFISRNISRLKYALAGIAFALKTDFSYRTQFYIGILIIGLFYFYTAPLNQTEILFLALAWILILITELQNTSFEAALDHLHPELHDNIGRSKDMAAGAVLTAGFFLLFVMVMIIIL